MEDDEIQELKEQQALELHYQKKQSKKWNTIWADKPLKQVFMDLADMSKLKDKPGNKKYAFMLVWIDTNSRFLEIRPLKNKTANEVYSGLKSIPYIPEIITTDSGGEYKGAVNKYFDEHNIEHRTVEVGDHKALAIVDRVIRTIRRWLDILFETNGNFDWVSYIDDLVKAYNMRFHPTIKARPVDIINGKATNKQKIERDESINEFEPGDKVRREVQRHLFSKGGRTWSKQIYTVLGRNGFKIVLSNKELVSPRELLKTKFEKPVDDEKQIHEQVQEITKEKKIKQLLKKEDIQPENIIETKRHKKKKVILDL